MRKSSNKRLDQNAQTIEHTPQERWGQWSVIDKFQSFVQGCELGTSWESHCFNCYRKDAAIAIFKYSDHSTKWNTNVVGKMFEAELHPKKSKCQRPTTASNYWLYKSTLQTCGGWLIDFTALDKGYTSCQIESRSARQVISACICHSCIKAWCII
jgi:hypothetical protein